MKRFHIFIICICIVLSLFGCSRRVETASSASFTKDLLEVYFLDVGEGDATFLQLNGHTMLIDGGDRSNSSFLYSFLQSHGVKKLDFIIATHPHEDHVGGLAGALNLCSAKAAFSPVEESDSTAFVNFRKYLNVQNVPLVVPKAGTVYSFGDAQVQVLGPLQTNTTVNNSSIILRIVYKSTSFLFTGDAEVQEENDVLAVGYLLKSDVLKVGHHGSNTSSSAEWLSAAAPSYAVISCGKNNAYGHPTDDVLERLDAIRAKILRTDLYGTIRCSSDGSNISIQVEHMPSAAEADPFGRTAAKEPTQTESSPDHFFYILNINNMKFHIPSCSSVGKIAEKNIQKTSLSREDLINLGYTPCGVCSP